MFKNKLLFKQIIIIMWLLAAAISSIEITKEFPNGGFKNWKVYFFALIFIVSVIMYFVRKKQRFEQKIDEKK